LNRIEQLTYRLYYLQSTHQRTVGKLLNTIDGLATKLTEVIRFWRRAFCIKIVSAIVEEEEEISK
jgi:hypothetical protein